MDAQKLWAEILGRGVEDPVDVFDGEFPGGWVGWYPIVDADGDFTGDIIAADNETEDFVNWDDNAMLCVEDATTCGCDDGYGYPKNLR